MEIIAETLRLELEPFGVSVLSIVTGAVRTNCLSYFQDWKLPEDSLYKPIEQTIAARARGEDGVKRTDRMEYGEKVVSEIVGGSTDKVWCGNMAGLIKFMATYFPWLMVSLTCPVTDFYKVHSLRIWITDLHILYIG